jgi:hypothetical protein
MHHNQLSVKRKFLAPKRYAPSLFLGTFFPTLPLVGSDTKIHVAKIYGIQGTGCEAI